MLLSQTGQREVGRGHPARLAGHAMLDQACQLTLVIVHQRLNARGVEHLVTVSPLQVQLAAIHLTFNAQPVGQRRLFILCHACAFDRRGEQRLLVKLAVELPQVVEGNARRGQICHLRANLCARQIAQQAVAHALVRHAAQLFLDGFDRVAQPADRRQLHREQTGKPAHGA